MPLRLVQLNVRQPPIAVVAVLLCAMLSGCGKKSAFQRVPVSGTVVIDDKPLTVGSVRFIPIGGGKQSITKINNDGKFDFGEEGVVVAKHRVEVIASEQVGPTGYRWHAPEKYANYSTSGLEQEITGPTDDVKLTLTWAGGKPYTVKGPAADADPKNLKSRK
jgi:hypothetical protein